VSRFRSGLAGDIDKLLEAMFETTNPAEAWRVNCTGELVIAFLFGETPSLGLFTRDGTDTLVIGAP